MINERHKPYAVGKAEILSRERARERPHNRYLLSILETRRIRESENPTTKPKTFAMSEQLRAIWINEKEPLQIKQIEANLRKLYDEQYINAREIVDNLLDKGYIEMTNIEYHKISRRIMKTSRARKKVATQPRPTIVLRYYYPTAKGLRVIHPKDTDILPTVLKELDK